MHRIYRDAPLVQEAFFWCTKWTKRCSWCTKRASGVPTRTRRHKTPGSGQRKKTAAEQGTASVLTYAGFASQLQNPRYFSLFLCDSESDSLSVCQVCVSSQIEKNLSYTS